MPSSLTCHRRDTSDVLGRNASQFRQQHRVIMPRRRQEMHGTSLGHGLSHRLAEIAIRRCRTASNKSGFLRHRRLRPHPYYVIYVNIVPINMSISAVQVQDCGKIWLIYPPEIQEAAVLTEFVVIAPIILRSIRISRKNRDSA